MGDAKRRRCSGQERTEHHAGTLVVDAQPQRLAAPLRATFCLGQHRGQRGFGTGVIGAGFGDLLLQDAAVMAR